MKRSLLRTIGGILALTLAFSCFSFAFADASDTPPSPDAQPGAVCQDDGAPAPGESATQPDNPDDGAPAPGESTTQPDNPDSGAPTPGESATQPDNPDSGAGAETPEAPAADGLFANASEAPAAGAAPAAPVQTAQDLLAMDAQTVWSMEALPDDLYESGLASDTHGEYGGHANGHVDLLAAPGKGWNGSGALAFVYRNATMENQWADGVQIQIAADATAVTDWSAGRELWFWVDASAFSHSDLMLELKLNGETPSIGGAFYWIADGQRKTGTLPAGYNGADYARIPLERGYRGWMGVSLEAFGALQEVTSIGLYIEPWGERDSQNLPQTLYLDEFCLMGQPADSIWDMEGLPEGALPAAWASGQGLDAGFVQMRGADGRGLDGSRALEYHFVSSGGSQYWANGVTVQPSNDPAYQSDWRGGDTLWFWLDAREIDCDILLELTVNGAAPLAGEPFFTVVDGVKTQRTLAPAWEGQTNARIPTAAAFVGWVGLPLSSFAEPIQEAGQLQFYTQPWPGDIPSADTPLDKSLYFDAFRLTRRGAQEPEDVPHGELFNRDVAYGEGPLYVDTTRRHQQVRAFGVSDAWWAPGIGTRGSIGELVELLFTDEGIALNNYRHNIGGSVAQDRGDADSYDAAWRAPYSPLKPDGTYDITRNEGAYQVLQRANALGVIDDFTLFFNSPPSTMTVSGRTCANPGQAKTNLKAECRDAFADYVVDITERYLADGVAVKYVSPVNEPQWAWEGGQEGCHYEPEEAFDICRRVIRALNERAAQNPALRSVKVSMPETAQWGNSSYTHDLYLRMISDPEVAPYIDHFCGHSYGANASVKAGLASFIRNAAVQLPVHQSEWGCSYGYPAKGMDTAVETARVLYEDLTILNAESWSWWIGVSHYNYSDGLIYVNDSNDSYELTKRFWAYGNYSKFIKQHTRITLDESALPEGVYASGYLGPDETRLVYVLVNEASADKTVSFAGLPAGAVGQVYETSARYDCALRGTMTVDSGYALPAQSVTTFVFDRLDLSQVENGANPDRKPEPELPSVPPAKGMQEKSTEVFTFAGLAPMHLQTPDDHTLPELFYVVDPTHNINEWNDAIKSNYALNYLYDADIVTGSPLDGGEGLQWTVLETTERTSELCFALANDPSGNSVSDWSGAKALDFYLDLSEFGEERVGMYLRLTETDTVDGAAQREIWTLNSAGLFWTQDGSGGWTPHAMTGERMDLPAGYQGWVRLMLDARSFNPVGWTAPVSGVLEHTDVTHLWFGLQNQSAVGSKAWIDAFSIVREEPTQSVTPPPDSRPGDEAPPESGGATPPSSPESRPSAGLPPAAPAASGAHSPRTGGITRKVQAGDSARISAQLAERGKAARGVPSPAADAPVSGPAQAPSPMALPLAAAVFFAAALFLLARIRHKLR